MQLRDGVSADFSRSAIMIGDTLRSFLKTTSNNGCLMINFTDDKDGADYTRREAL